MGITYDEMVALFAAESAIKPPTYRMRWPPSRSCSRRRRGRHHRRDLQRRRRNGGVLSVVGTHFPDDRDVVESALQRMREAFEALRDGRRGPSRAEEEFLAGYDTARDMVDTCS